MSIIKATPLDRTYYVVCKEGEVAGANPMIITEEEAIKLAKAMALDDVERFNIFKLVQTHTYAPGTCHTCTAQTIGGGALPDGRVPQ